MIIFLLNDIISAATHSLIEKSNKTDKMTFLEKLNAIERLDQLIRLRATGKPDEVANQLGISRRTFFNLVKLMKGMNAPIEYCNTKHTYYYKVDCEFIVVIFETQANNENISFLKKE